MTKRIVSQKVALLWPVLLMLQGSAWAESHPTPRGVSAQIAKIPSHESWPANAELQCVDCGTADAVRPAVDLGTVKPHPLYSVYSAILQFADPVEALPEPRSIVLLGAGLLILSGIGRRRLIRKQDIQNS
jgi:hypothetical protein